MDLEKIVNSVTKEPTIINENSRFVVATYWWGNNKNNQNLGRPCMSFYEMLLKKAILYFNNALNTAMTKKPNSKLDAVAKELFSNYEIDKTGETFDKIVSKYSTDYMNSIYEYCGLTYNEANKDEKAMKKLSKMESTPSYFEYKDFNYVKRILKIIVRECILINRKQIKESYVLKKEREALFKKFNEKKGKMSELDKKAMLFRLSKMQDTNKKIQESIKTVMKNKQIQFSTEHGFRKTYKKMNIFDVLIRELQYKQPITYDKMIEHWENNCRECNCNFIAVEYPDFTQEGGYQMAINAKPLFIKKMLEICEGRSVLYIDGDMNVRKYPHIFDMQDVDFMARGWWMDPRSSHKLDESIMYDPYVFETSGGTMWFSQSEEAKHLIEAWIKESDKPHQKGKADDRILSMVFNAKKYLCNMKIIQLPIEYLWLSLAYDERMMEQVYDWNQAKMDATIFIDHPECLTSEETAEGAGASSDRNPKYYSFLDLEEYTPASEEMHEYILYPDANTTLTGMKDYFAFMDTITYIDDGNEDLYKYGLVDEEDSGNNEQPIYVVPHKEQYGNKKYSGESETINEIVKLNQRRATKAGYDLNAPSFKYDIYNVVRDDKYNVYVITHKKMRNKFFIPLLLRLLQDGHTVIYNPCHMSGYNKNIYKKMLNNLGGLYKNTEFGFNPDFKSTRFSEFFKPIIKENQPMLFRPCEIFMQFLSMHLFIDDLSSRLTNGSYEMMSRVRMSYIFPAKGSASRTRSKASSSVRTTKKMGGGRSSSRRHRENPHIKDYEEGLKSMYK